MDKTQAVALIETLFDKTFAEDTFVHFCTNLFNDFTTAKATPVQSGTYVYAPYRNHIKSFKRVGQYTDPSGEILDVLAVKVYEGYKLERTRTGLRNFAIEYLKRKDDRDSLLIAFHSDDCPDWRLSFVKLEYKTSKDEKGRIKARQEATSARRYSFLVGENEPCHTAKRQLLPLLLQSDTNPTLFDLEHCFNIEKVTKEFFEQYKALFVDLQEQLDAVIKKNKKISADFETKKIDSSAFAKKLLGQIVFLYFIQKKGWLGVPKDKSFGYGDKRFLKTLFKQAEDAKANYYNEYLEFLFYEALAAQRTSADPSYYKKFNCRIPFLNGGLFEPIKDYDWKSAEINLPNDIFHNTKPTKENDVGTGILDVFDRYNFTVKEDEPLDKEVAVDPEMLGKVFENLLEVKDRKSKGAFYTPREIVHYMCQESLINYLDTSLNSETGSYQKFGEKQTDLFGNTLRKQTTLESENKETKIPKTDIDAFIKNSHLVVEDNRKNDNSYTWKLPEAIKRHARLFDAALADIKVCDPAIGSGAFPVGMLNEIVKARTALTPYMKLKDDDDSRTQYHLKRECIQNSLYGVDIDESAIDIAKLRLWLSLVVDEESIQDIEPLPNLDYKIVCGNSLLGLPDGVMHDDGLEKEIEELKEEYFGQTDNKQKRKLKNSINDKFKEIIKSMRVFSKDVPDISFDFKIHFSEVWHGHNGFDIVIGNPPYGGDISEKEKDYLKNHYSYIVERIRNTFIYFLGMAYEKIAQKGIVSLIIPNEYLFQIYMTKARRFFLNEARTLFAFNLGEAVFDAIVPCCIVGFKKEQLHEYNIKSYDFRGCEIEEIDNKLRLNDVLDISQKVIIENPNSVFSFDIKKNNLLKKIFKDRNKLESFCIDIANGISTSCDKVYVIEDQFALKNKFEKKYLKPTLKGGDINKYYCPDETHKYLLYITQAFEVKTGHNIYNYLKDNKNFLIEKSVEKKTGNRDWHILFRPREESLFISPKILIRQTGDSIIACSDKTINYYCIDSLNVLQLKPEYLEIMDFFLAILNSTIANFLYKEISQESGRVLAQVKPQRLKMLPIVQPDKKSIKTICNLVNKFGNRGIADNATIYKCFIEIDAYLAHLYSLTESEYQLILEGTEDTFRITALNYFRDIQKGILK